MDCIYIYYPVITGWWFQTFLELSPLFSGEDFQFDVRIFFPDGLVVNHQAPTSSWWVGTTWRISPFSNWLITMVSKSPK